MKTSSQLLLTFLFNALWQITLIAALASLGAWLLRQSAARYQHWLWVGALCLSLLVPAVTAVNALPNEAFSDTPPALLAKITEPVSPTGAAPFLSGVASNSSGVYALNAKLALALLLIYAAILLFRFFHLIKAWAATRKILSAAVQIDSAEKIAEIMRHCETSLNIPPGRASICSSQSVPLPVTAGLFRPVIILPDSLVDEGDADLLTAAIGHEYIHVARLDYLFNLIYEVIFLPISFHPAAALLRNRIKQTRELCCDELMAARILNARVYARSLVALAGSAPSLRKLSVTTTVGIADADILEARIMSLLTKPKLNRRWKNVLLVAVSLSLLLPSLAAVAFAMRLEVAPMQEPAQLEKELQAKREADAVKRQSRTEGEFKERMARDPRFRDEMQRKLELEVEMRTVRQVALLRVARISMDQAIQIATSQVPGKVLVCSLDADKWEEPGKLAKDGVVFYRVEIADEAAPGGLTHVWVNAVDGSTIRTERELPRKSRSRENNQNR